jgi:hypothetical protein
MKTRKEIKQEYKQMKFPMGVFQIRNILNDKVFIGSNLHVVAEWNSQKFQLNAGMHPNAELQKDWKELGAENFVYEILEEMKESEDKPLDYAKEIKTLEKLYLEKFQANPEKIYNRL